MLSRSLRLQKYILVTMFIIYEFICIYFIYNCDSYIKKILILILNFMIIYKISKRKFNYIDRFYYKFKENNKSLIIYNIFTSIITFVIFIIYLLVIKLLLKI